MLTCVMQNSMTSPETAVCMLFPLCWQAARLEGQGTDISPRKASKARLAYELQATPAVCSTETGRPWTPSTSLRVSHLLCLELMRMLLEAIRVGKT